MEFLTKEELIEITGYKQPTKQIDKLKELNYPVQGINRFGTPLVIFKDVFGFRRDGQFIPRQKVEQKWQPPPP